MQNAADDRGLGEAGPVPVPVRLPRPEPAVLLLGRPFPRASGAERLAWLGILATVLSVLATAFMVVPDDRGYGTHEQIKIMGRPLDPCGFKIAVGIPCPSCGFTTTFALAAHGRVVDAALNQPFGFLVFLATLASVPLALGAVVRGASVQTLLDRLPYGKVAVGGATLWLLGWAWKVAQSP